MSSSSRQQLFDGSAIGLSVLCLAHCLALPVAASVGPLLGVGVVGEHVSQATHLVLALAALPISVLGLWLGFRARGIDWRTAALAVTGLGLMFVGASHMVDAAITPVFTVPGVLAVAAAHLINWRRRDTTPVPA